MKSYLYKANNSLDFNIKDIDTTGRRVVLYSAAFNNKDRDRDVIVKGAFTKTIKEQGPAGIGEIWHLLFHDTSKGVSRPSSMEQDNYGLLSVVPMPDTTLGSDTLKMYQAGLYKHHSIGYQTIKSQAKSDYTELQELRLFEHSTVLWAANPAAVTVGVKDVLKSMSRVDIQQEIDITLKAYRNGTFSDETFALLDIKLKQLIAASTSIEDTPADPVEESPEPLIKGVDPDYARMKLKLLTLS